MKITNNTNIYQNYNNPSNEPKKESSAKDPVDTFLFGSVGNVDSLSKYATNAVIQPLRGAGLGGVISARATFKALGGGEYAMSGTQNLLAGAAGLAAGVAGLAVGGAVGLAAGVAGFNIDWGSIGGQYLY